MNSTADNAYVLCDMFGVNRQAGYDIRNGKSWSSVTGAKRKDQHQGNAGL